MNIIGLALYFLPWVLYIFVLFCLGMITIRAGYNWKWTILLFVPGFSVFIFLGILAFKKWPLEKQKDKDITDNAFSVYIDEEERFRNRFRGK
jgi:hypothetical protein